MKPPAPSAASRLSGRVAGALTALALAVCAAASLAGAQQTAPKAATVRAGSKAADLFEAKIRPVLLENCAVCHSGPNASADFRVDRPLDAAAAEKLIAAVRYDGKVKMPPAAKLPGHEIAALEAWVKAGAPWPANAATAKPADAAAGRHWAFVPPKRPLEPPVAVSGIDSFITARLAKSGLTPAPPADRRTLLRRVTYDLTGLPPTPEQVREFLADTRPGAYERAVDRLLASPAFGERGGRHWRDVARYADSNGLDENLAFGNAWRYRDWVIDAVNRDLPYDEFLRHQIAGDLMPTSDETERNRRLTATGFLTLGAKVLAEQDKPKLVMDVIDEQIDVVSKATMGLTIACARCHDHKFDPITTKDYYALAGIFKSTKTMGNLDFVSRWNERPVPTAALIAEQKAVDAKVAAAQKVVDAARARARAALEARVAADKPRYERAAKAALLFEAETFARGTAIRDSDTYGKEIGVIRTGRAGKTTAEWDITVPAAGRWEVSLRYASNEQRPIRLLINGKEVRKDAAGRITGSFNPEGQQWEPLAVADLPAGKVTLAAERDGAWPHVDKVLLSPEPGLIPDLVAGGGKVPEKADAFFSAEEKAAVEKAEKERQAIAATRPVTPVVMAVEEAPKPENVKVHIRGSTESLGDVVPRGLPAVLCGGEREEIPADAGSGRLQFAQWLTRPEHPLTARVAVNRVWQILFGQGLVSTPDNWGLKGEKPSHPELLDWLAVTFATDDAWSLKRLVRRMVLSRTYRQASLRDYPKAAQADPENRLLWRQNRRRLEAEPLRDSLFAVAGTLDRTRGGTLLTTKNGDYVTNDQSANQAFYDAPRRAIYLPVIRNAVYDFFQVFDFGDPSLVNAHRPSTTVAPQALLLLNSPLVRQQSQAFAEMVLKDTRAADDAARIRLAYERALQRAPFPAETQVAQDFLGRVESLLAAREPDAKKREAVAWGAFCQTLLASNEFVYVE